MLAQDAGLNQDQAYTLLNTANRLIYQRFHKYDAQTELSRYIKKIYSPIHGYVYLVHAVGTDRYKIGKTGAFTRRIKELRSQSPYPIDVVYYYWSPDPIADEEYLHYYFRQARVYGEWFALHELTEQESRIIPNWEAAQDYSIVSITQDMREKYRWSRNHAIETVRNTCSGEIQITTKIKPLFIDLLQSRVEGAAFVMQNQKLLGRNYDLFFCSILDSIYRSIAACKSVNKLAFACAFLETDMIPVINELLQQVQSPNPVLRVKEAINTALSAFLTQIEKIEVVE